jgi:hypothetical protein
MTGIRLKVELLVDGEQVHVQHEPIPSHAITSLKD